MISNVLDVDEALLQYSLAGYGSMALFYDFKAAFPSVEHKLLHSYFEALRWPTWLLWFIQMLYSYNYCFISLRSGLYAGFTLTRGYVKGVHYPPPICCGIGVIASSPSGANPSVHAPRLCGRPGHGTPFGPCTASAAFFSFS